MGHIHGVVVGTVKKVNDDNGEGRVLVEFPWMGGNNQNYWAPVATLMSGSGRGSWFMPEVGDEVLVAFDHEDVNHPYILGFLWNGNDKPPETSSHKRLLKSVKGHTILLDDTDEGEKIVITTGGGHQISLDDTSTGQSITLKTAGNLTVTLSDLDSSIQLQGGCPHGGKGTSIPTDPKWVINGGFVLVENDTGVLACPFIPLPCVGYQLQSMGLNATQIDGRKVILETDFNQTFTGLPLLITEFHQTIDNSTPAPIPAGQSAPPLPANLADIAQPIVTGVPPALAFNSTTMVPPALIPTFTLVSDHPLLWILTLINEPGKYHLTVTNGLPPGLLVAPAGGSWDTPTLVVTVTMTNLFMASLGRGKHHFFMTAVSQRGLSSYAEVILTVS